MKVEIKTINDESFHFVKTKESKENDKVESETVTTEIQEDTLGIISPAQRPAPRSAPIENNKGAGWFAGTSWE
jgi:phage head maturation protease